MNKYFLSALIVALMTPSYIFAQVAISEIMYDLDGTDTGREWIEIQNTSNAPVDLSGWKLFEANTNHGLTARSGAIIPPNGFAIIVDDISKFITDNSNFGGLVFDSTFSLSNTGESISIRNPQLVDVDSVKYDPSIGAEGDGNTLQKINNSWVASSPTPGAVNSNSSTQPSSDNTKDNTSNQTVDTNSSEENTSSGSLSSYDSQAIAYTGNDVSEFEITAGRDRLSAVGTPISFEVRVKKPNDISANQTYLRWSFGDGSQDTGSAVSHIYAFPGDYNVVVNGSYSGAKAVVKINVKIIEPNVSITNGNPDFIEVTNQGQYEVNIGKWLLSSGHTYFVIPQDTLISSKKSVKLPSSFTKIIPTGDIKIQNPSSKIISTYALKYLPKIVLTPSTTVSLPTGINKETLEKKLQIALANTPTPNQSKISQPKLNSKPSTTSLVGIDKSDVSQTGNVIFTVDKPNNSGVIDKILTLPKRGLKFLRDLIF